MSRTVTEVIPVAAAEEPAAAASTSGRPGGRRLAGVLAVPVGYFVVSRLAVLLAVGVALLVKPGLTLRHALLAWDSGWYLHLAEFGYPNEVPLVDGLAAQSSLAFFPLHPLTVRVVSGLSGLSLFGAALLVTMVAGAVATVLIWMLIREVGDRRLADRTAALFCFFPASFVLLVPYSEALMLSFSAGCLLALLRRRWIVAGLLAALATATRPNAVALCLACGWAAFVAIRQRREWRALAAPLLSPLGLVAFTVYLGVHTGDPLASLRTQRYGWGQRFDWGATTVAKASDLLQQPLDINIIVATSALAFIAVSAWLLWRWRPPAVLTIYALGVAVPPLLSAMISSRPRFAMTAFPLLAAVAARARPAVFHAVIGCSAVLLGALTILTVATDAATP